MGSIPVIHSNTTQCICSVCFAELIIEKVKSRKVFTVAYGELQIREKVKKCPVCGKVYRSAQLPEMVKAGCNYSYDCIVEAGRLRYIDKRQISEIQNIFTLRHHLNISQTQIRRLCYNFLYYLGRFHYHSAEHISNVFQQQGGYILYVDSTCEGRGVHILTCLDGQSGYVLYSKKIKSENSEDLQTAFGVVKNMFGVPLCCVHDMGNGINKALDIIFEGVMRIICHFHLLRDIGNDLLKELYRSVQKSLSGHRIYADIRYQTLALEKTAGSRKKAEDLFFSTFNTYNQNAKELLVGTLYGYLQSLKTYENCGDGYGFPFDRPKLEYYRLMVKICADLRRIDKIPVFDTKTKKECRLYKIKDVLENVLHDNDLKLAVAQLERQVGYFDKFRKILRIAEPNDKNGLNDQGKITTAKDLTEAETKLRKYMDALKTKAENDKKIAGVIKQLEKYWDKIFASPIKVMVGNEEKTIIPQRTNNLSEQFYRKIKHLLRRLSGKPTVSKDIDYLPEEIVLVENLKNQHYVENIVGGLNTLAKKFAQLDIQNINMYLHENDLQIKVPMKIIRKLKDFQPLEKLKAL